MTNNGDQTNAGGDQAIRIAITPTWEAIAKISIEALVNGTEEGQCMAREEIIDLGIKLDDAKEIIEEKKDLNLVPLQSLKDAVDDKNKIILDQNERALEMERQLNKQALALANYQRQADKDLETIRKLEKKLGEKAGELATLRDQIINLGEDPEYDAELANGDGQDTSIDEQVANDQPYREGDE